MEYPSSFSHLLRILWQNDIKKAFSLSNPDGYFYMLYLKTCIKFFVLNFLISGITMMAICLYANSSGRGSLDAESASFFQLTSLGHIYHSSLVYTVSLVLSFFTIILAYMFLYDFCSEMLMFEFQPDQKIMDQFIQMHTLMIKGINPHISPEKAQNGIGKVFALRFGARNILKIQVFRPIQHLHKFVEKRKKSIKKLKKVKKANHNNPEGQRELIQVGSKFMMN